MFQLAIVIIIVLYILHHKGKKDKQRKYLDFLTRESVGANEIIVKREEKLELAVAKNPDREFIVIENTRIDVRGSYYYPESMSAIISDGMYSKLFNGFEKDGVNETGYHNAPLVNAKLVPVSNNRHDKNAVEVHVSRVGGEYVHVGHVPREECRNIRKLLESVTKDQELLIQPILTYLRGAGRDEYSHSVKLYIYVLEVFDEAKHSKPKTAKPKTQKVSSTDELREFKKLADEGIITQDEFEAKKKQILKST